MLTSTETTSGHFTAKISSLHWLKTFDYKTAGCIFQETMLCALNNLPLNVARISFIKAFNPRISNGSTRFIMTVVIFFIIVTTIN